MSLKGTVRKVIRSDTRVYAKVESIALGKATVRLGKNGSGARMTNIPYSGDIIAGDVVIVDQSIETPMVIGQVADSESSTILASAEDSKLAGTEGLSIPTACIRPSENITDGFPNGSSFQASWEIREDISASLWHLNRMDDVAWDTAEMVYENTWGTSNKFIRNGFVIPQPGAYFYSLNVLVGTDLPPSRKGQLEVAVLTYPTWNGTYYWGSPYFCPGQIVKRNYTPTGKVMMCNVSGFHHFFGNEFVWFSIEQTYERQSTGTNTMTLYKDYDGLKSQFSIVFIAPQANVVSATRGWKFTEYWGYP